MKRLLLALVPWMAMTSAARAQSPADVVFTHYGVVKERCLRLGDECYVPFSFLDDVGLSYVQKDDEIDVRAGTQHVTVSVRDMSGSPMVPLRYLIGKLGADSSWSDERLTVLAPLSQVQIKAGVFNVQSAFPIKPKVSTMDDPNRIVLDLEGAELTSKTVVDLDGTSRISQFKPNVVRVVLETNFDPAVEKLKLGEGTAFQFAADGTTANKSTSPTTPAKREVPHPAKDELEKPIQAGPRVPLTQPQTIQYDPASDPDMQPPVVTAGPVAMVGPLSVDSEGDKVASLTLKIVGGLKKMPVFRRPDPSVLEIVLAGAQVADGVDFSLAKGPTIRDVQPRTEDGNLILALTLARPMGIEFSMSDAGLQIQLLKPNVGNGKLAGKIVVVDPGHGGHDDGTQSAGLNEKDLTLKIGKLVSQKLAAEGATVIMTRKTDVFIPLDERPAIANRNGADFFVSVHINSNEADNTASGTITFYHGHDPICQLLADCIEHEIVQVNAIGGMGTWSDQRIYHTGFAVLRGAKMPAVLVECGFLNTKKDRARMITDDWQNAVAGAIVKGIKAYLGDEGKKN